MIDLTPISDLVKDHPWAILLSGAGTLIIGTAAIVAAAYKLLLDMQKTVVSAYKGNIEAIKERGAAEMALREARYDREVYDVKQKYERRAEQIDRQIVNDDFLDVANFGPIDEIQDEKERRFFAEDKFWAHEEPEIWDYEKTNSLTVYDEWFGEKLKSIPRLNSQLQATKTELEYPVHLWRGKSPFGLEIEGHNFIQRMYPFVIVQRVPIVSPEDYDAPTKTLFGFLQWLDLFDAADENTTFKVTNMQNVAGTMYLRGFFHFRNIMINKIPREHYYLLRELMFIPTTNGMYTITTGIPNLQRSKDETYFAHLTTWLNDFRLSRH